MGNMSYCRFENTYQDLRDCEEHMGDPEQREGESDEGTLSKSEAKYRARIVQLCKRIAEDWDE